jgi:F0F1-type ATP synthase assembly protein I
VNEKSAVTIKVSKKTLLIAVILVVVSAVALTVWQISPMLTDHSPRSQIRAR